MSPDMGIATLMSCYCNNFLVLFTSFTTLCFCHIITFLSYQSKALQLVKMLFSSIYIISSLVWFLNQPGF